MLETLKVILEIQEFDMKMIRLMRLKNERKSELQNIASLRSELQEQLVDKQKEIQELTHNIATHENRIHEIKEHIKKLEAKQGSIKKVEEFNALTQEMSAAERERVATVHVTSDLVDKRTSEEEILEKIKESLASSEDSSKRLEVEIKNSIKLINEEGSELKIKREALVKHANPDIFKVYERLLKNKKDRVVVPIENRTCSGCYIALTAQHENMVRKGERMVFCEHCSRILYWQESEALEGTPLATKRRRRRAAT